MLIDLTDFNWQEPDVASVFRKRAAVLREIRKRPKNFLDLKVHYRENIADFINDWGCTFDPRNAGKKDEEGRQLPSLIPFVLFPKQIEWIEWFFWHWKNAENGLTEKSREVGVSWLAVSTVASMAMLYEGFVGGFGSRKAEYVDKTGDPKSLFWKAREFIANVPPEFRAGWRRDTDAHMRITFPQNGSAITGEGGDSIGRGDRTSVYVVDEAAHLEHPDTVDAALSQTTLCRIDVSSVKGMGNSFAQKRHAWDDKHVFTFHWRDDPRKDEEWYADQKRKISNDVIVAQELDIDYSAAQEGVVIPSAWVQAAIDAHKELGFGYDGIRMAAMDVADEGRDLCALAIAHGVIVTHVTTWSGSGSHIHASTAKAFMLCDQHNVKTMRYDADGMGAGVRSAAHVLNESRVSPIHCDPFRGSGQVFHPDATVKGTDRKNKDFFMNAKAQAWWTLRDRFEKTYLMRNGIEEYPFEELISIQKDGSGSWLSNLTRELSQATWSTMTASGKMLIDKTPEGTRSPNMADAVVMRFAPLKRVTAVSSTFLNRLRTRSHALARRA